MKKKTVKKVVMNECYSALPPWSNHKTKEAAWHAGFNSGRTEGFNTCEHKMKGEIERAKLNRERGDAIIKLINAAAQNQDAISHMLIDGFMKL